MKWIASSVLPLSGASFGSFCAVQVRPASSEYITAGMAESVRLPTAHANDVDEPKPMGNEPPAPESVNGVGNCVNCGNETRVKFTGGFGAGARFHTNVSSTACV